MKLLRFGAVGVLNTLIDFSVLNLLIFALGVREGGGLVLCNVAAFLAASLNSYFLNRSWTFRQGGDATLRQYLYFLALTLGGVAVNSLVLYLLVTWIPRPAGVAPTLWINAAKAAATGVSMVWNYLVCRHIVFRAKRY